MVTLLRFQKLLEPVIQVIQLVLDHIFIATKLDVKPHSLMIS